LTATIKELTIVDYIFFSLKFSIKILSEAADLLKKNR
jgi:hypothetical protein